ncbi:MAG: hypothetical protein ACJAU0_001835 [Flavobacteriales bacterium]|jgi:hypothetical protein
MKLIEPIQRPAIKAIPKLAQTYAQFSGLLNKLNENNLPDTVANEINKDIEELNSVSDSEKILRKQIRKKQGKIITFIEKELKFVVKNHYRNTWLAIGMSVFGIPLGIIFGSIFENMAFIGIGLPIGMVFGIALGTQMDKKAFAEGRQIDIELKL